MTRKQLQVLIQAGAFSVALLSGVAYADNTTPGSDSSVAVDSGTVSGQQASGAQDPKQATSTKAPAQHGCAGAGGCGAQ